MRLLHIVPLIICCITACANNNDAAERQRQHLSRIADSVSRQQFITLEFMAGDKPAKAEIDTRYVSFKEKKEFPLSLFVTVNTIEKDSLGHPTKKESVIFSAIEGEILKKLDKVAITAFIGRTTMNGYRDLIFYIKADDQKKVSEAVASVQKNYPRIKEYVFENDPDWEAVAGFYNSIRN